MEPDPDREIVLGIGGQSIRVRFADVTLHVGPSDRPEEEWLEWQAEVGFVERWRASWPVLLGQRGFFDQFTVTMNRGAQTVAVTAFEDFDERFPPVPAETG